MPETQIKLHNTRTRKKEEFVPLDEKNVRMYVCGPTVYDRAHLGNARPVVVFDVLNRLLRHVYGEDAVTYVRNFTDVDDKINARAAESGRKIGDITEETIGWFLEDMAALGAREPDAMPRATEFIPQMVEMIEGLIAKGHAYEAEGHVLFAVGSYAAYGKLSGRSIDDMIAGARVEVAPYKRNPMDFVLWKPSTEGQPGWDSPWGYGRPGWHIECSAMAYELLGESFDIHGGGNDLMFPHHENEIAQSCCAHPEGEFAQVWMHNEMLQVEGKKMSKSLGNFFTVRDLLDHGIPGEVIRFVFLSTHYRKPMDWTAEKAKEAKDEVSSWARKLSGNEDLLQSTIDPHLCDSTVVEALADDLNTSLALTRIKQLARFIDNSPEYLSLSDEDQLRHEKIFASSAKLVGFDVIELARQELDRLDVADLEHFELSLAEERLIAIESKDFSKLDQLKQALNDAGVEVQMSKSDIKLTPRSDFDPSKLEALR
ncbi:cysteine--tRNA ligase [Roseovarius nanhaiticus]|uniref:cysteine--tRNA ligase n=1 Tax=Roseovarius nanhaiticus TaxID=573024 RepID=UPI0024927A27|nr:cysteine--tRNA ligase [Roseovarius nanhaiticus]